MENENEQPEMNERPEKASLPIEAALPPGVPASKMEWEEAFGVHFYVSHNPPSLHVRWDIVDPEAQAVFFRTNPLAAAMLVALTHGPATPPVAREECADANEG